MSMTAEEVLSVLGQFELEVKQREQQQHGIRHIREVLSTFVEVDQKLTALQAEYATLEAKAKTLRERYAAKKAKEKDELAEEQAYCAEAKQAVQTQRTQLIEDATHTMHELEVQVKQKREETAAALKEMDAQIAEKTVQFSEISKAVLALKQKHGLVAA